MALRQACSALQSDNCLARAGRARDARRSSEILFNDATLRWVQKNCPFLPWIFERALQFLDVLDDWARGLC